MLKCVKVITIAIIYIYVFRISCIWDRKRNSRRLIKIIESIFYAALQFVHLRKKCADYVSLRY